MDDMKAWYVLHTYSGYENKVKENIDLRKESMNMENNIFDVIVPEHEVSELKDGEKQTKVQKKFPGYVLVEMIMSDEAWFIVRNTPGVTGFVGSHGAGSKPAPLLDEEVEALMGDTPAPKQDIDLGADIGDSVEIIDGPFAGMSGIIEDISDETQKLKVVIEMFGRETVAELDFIQVKVD